MLSAAFGAAEVAVQVFADNPPIPRGTFAAIAAFVSFGAAIARVVAQESVSGGDQ